MYHQYISKFFKNHTLKKKNNIQDNKAFRHVDTLYKNLFSIYIVKEIYE